MPKNRQNTYIKDNPYLFCVKTVVIGVSKHQVLFLKACKIINYCLECNFNQQPYRKETKHLSTGTI